MKKIVISIIAISLMPFSLAESRINSVRCDRSLVIEGDSKASVISKCGNPISEDVIATDESSGIKTIELVYEINGKLKIITFKANKLISVKDA